MELLNCSRVRHNDEISLLKKMKELAHEAEIPAPWIEQMTLRDVPCKLIGPQLAPSEFVVMVQSLEGRSLLLEEFAQLTEYVKLGSVAADPLYYIQYAFLHGYLRVSSGFKTVQKRNWPLFMKRTEHTCRRCGSGGDNLFTTDCIFCGCPCSYCESCMQMGRVRFCSPMISSIATVNGQGAVQPNGLDGFITPWGLSDVQAEASKEALHFLLNAYAKNSPEPQRFLIWAVTGAGKTEMIFPMIAFVLSRGGKVLVTTPRKDVVLELQPRLKRAFPHTKVVTLYGGSEERWERGQLTIATTHQLMRFAEAFDLVIIDEIDAFPYHNNPMLEFAASKAVKPGGAYLFLSATPPEPLQKAVRRHQLPCARVPARFHRHPLPVPKIIYTEPLNRLILKNNIPQAIKQIIQISMDRGAQLFVFVPKINMVEPFIGMLRSGFPGITVEGTSSKDENRADKVVQFRQTQTRILVTTTILERGVTIPKSDVLILGADAPLFDSAALVQMSGRAGRSKDDPAGTVYFAVREKTSSVMGAIRQIRDMNKLALRKGFLHKS
ncbi:DEAD/DEAH box helicase [Paenibacillus thalictri]|nr:helicase-related protein [Paenibacillus thalictri]